MDPNAVAETASITTILVSAFVGAVAAILTNRIALKHQIQAENEYAILMKIWNRAFWLKSRANSLRPKLDSGNPNSADEKKRRLDAFDKAKTEFDEEMYLNKPFYPDGIYKCLRELGNNAVYESIDFYHKTASPDDQKYWADSDASAEKINRLVDQLCDAIRERIHFMYRIRQRATTVAQWLRTLPPVVLRPFRRIEPARQ